MQPRERLLKSSAECLSETELLAVIIGIGPPGLGAMGVAHLLLEQWREGFYPHIQRQDQASHSIWPQGIGPAQSARLQAVFEIARRHHRFHVQNRLRMKRLPNFDKTIGENAAEKIPAPYLCSVTEWMGFVPVLTGPELGSFCAFARGSRNEVSFKPVDLFGPLLAERPMGFYLFHNHPSGLTNPSEEDLDLTRHVRELGSKLSVPLLGHGVVSDDELTWIVL